MNIQNSSTTFDRLWTLNPSGECSQSPLHWRGRARIRVDCELFNDAVPFKFIDRVFAVMAICPRHTFQIVSEKPERMAEYFAGRSDGAPRWACVSSCVARMTVTLDGRNPSGIYLDAAGWPPPNVWLGVSASTQQQLDDRIPHLLGCPAAVRFLSIEPLSGPIDCGLEGLCREPSGDVHLRDEYPRRATYGPAIDWIIVSGGDKPLHPDWVRSLRDQCHAIGVPFYFRGWGEWATVEQFDPTTDSLYYWDDDRYGQPRGYESVCINMAGQTSKNADDVVDRTVLPPADFVASDPFHAEPEEVYRVGKKAAGRLLDGREWNEMPKAAEVAHA